MGNGLQLPPPEGPETDFSTGEFGTYTLNSNCTGSMVIYLPVPGVPTGTYYLKIMFVVSDGGRHIHEVVSEFMPPGFTEPQPTQTSADDGKVGSPERLNAPSGPRAMGSPSRLTRLGRLLC